MSFPDNARFANSYLIWTAVLYYLRARWMNPNTGRFLTADKYENPDCTVRSSHHGFNYAEADPIDRMDPTGFDATDRAIVSPIPGALKPVVALGISAAAVCILEASASLLGIAASSIDPDTKIVDVHRLNQCFVPGIAIPLGYDVADAVFESQIANMKYLEQDRYINDLGLIGDEHRAHEFRILAQQRMSDSVPLWVYRLSAILGGEVKTGKETGGNRGQG